MQSWGRIHFSYLVELSGLSVWCVGQLGGLKNEQNVKVCLYEFRKWCGCDTVVFTLSGMMKPARSVYSGSWTACAPRITLGRASGDLESDMRVVWWYWLYLPSWGQQKHRDLIPLYRQPEGSKVSPEAFDAQTAYEYTGPSPDTILHATWSIVRSHRTAREDSSPRRSIATRSWHTTLDAAAGRLQGRAGCHGPDAGRRGKLGDEHGGNKGCGPISPLRICPPTLSTYKKNWETVSISDFRNYVLGVEYSRLTYVPRGLGKEWERQKKGRVLVSKFIVNADNENSAWFLLGICVENKDWMVEAAIVHVHVDEAVRIAFVLGEKP